MFNLIFQNQYMNPDDRMNSSPKPPAGIVKSMCQFYNQNFVVHRRNSYSNDINDENRDPNEGSKDSEGSKLSVDDSPKSSSDLSISPQSENERNEFQERKCLQHNLSAKGLVKFLNMLTSFSRSWKNGKCLN